MTSATVLTSPYQLSFVYYKAIAADDFIDAAETWLKRNLSAVDFAAIAPEMDTFNSAYQSVVSGDRCDIRRNSDGLFLIKNGETISHSQSPPCWHSSISISGLAQNLLMHRSSVSY